MRRLVALVVLLGCDAEPTAADLGPIDLSVSLDALPDLTPAQGELGPPDLAPPPVQMVYVSGYAPQIARFALNPTTGLLTSMGTTAISGSPSFLAVDPSRRHLYALDEATSGTVRAFTIDGVTGALSPLGTTVSSGGNGPAYLSVDPLGKWLLVANYGDGKVSVVTLNADGSLGLISDTKTAGDNAHEIVADESDSHVFVPCKGGNFVAQYLFDAASGKLTPNGPATVAAPTSGAGPRHLILRGGFAYLIEENGSNLIAYTRDNGGRLTFLQSLSTLPAGFSGTNTAAELAASGGFLYGSNRGDDSLVQYSLAVDGRMTTIGFTKTGGKTPRSFTIDPAGRWLLVANQDSNEVRVLSLAGSSGVPAMTSVQVTAPSPSFVGVVVLPGS